jgi:hypothetical protein
VCEVEGDPDRRQLRGPIPWPWWLRACRLPGRALQVESAVWASVGWNGGRSATCEFSLAGWAELALGRKAVRLGLRALQSDGLILVEPRAGRSLIVSLLSRSSEASPDGPNYAGICRSHEQG